MQVAQSLQNMWIHVQVTIAVSLNVQAWIHDALNLQGQRGADERVEGLCDQERDI